MAILIRVAVRASIPMVLLAQFVLPSIRQSELISIAPSLPLFPFVRSSGRLKREASRHGIFPVDLNELVLRYNFRVVAEQQDLTTGRRLVASSFLDCVVPDF